MDPQALLERPPPLGQDSPSPPAGVTRPSGAGALFCAPATTWAGLPVPQGWCVRAFLGNGYPPQALLEHRPSPWHGY